jgi:exonuclease III
MVGRLRKDGQPDMRFKCNRDSAYGSLYSSSNYGSDLYPPGPTRIDGKPDMRYAANKEWVAQQNVRVQAQGPLKKDGHPDMHFRANREWAAQQYITVQTQGPLREDGQPDMRFKCNRESANGSLHSPNNYGNDLNPPKNPPGPLTKDKQPDMRYTANKEWVAQQNVGVQAPGPVKKDGQPDMHYPANREWDAKQNIAAQAPGPLRKDGQPNMRFAVNKKWVAEREAEKNVVANKEQVMNADVENVKFGLVNSRSLSSKLGDLDDEIEKSKLDIVAVTETWFKDDFDLKEARPTGFKGVHEPRRDGRRGGGVAIFYRDDIKLTRHSLVNYKSFEYIDVSLDIGSGKKIRLLNIYRPGGNGSSKDEFLEEFETLLRASMKGKGKLLITGDFNLAHEYKEIQINKKFQDLIDSNGLVQHIKTATHKDGRILDLIITRASDSLIKKNSIRVDKEFFSDHKFIKCTLLVEKEEIFEREE